MRKLLLLLAVAAACTGRPEPLPPLVLDTVLGPGEVRCGPVTKESELIGGPALAFKAAGAGLAEESAELVWIAFAVRSVQVDVLVGQSFLGEAALEVGHGNGLAVVAARVAGVRHGHVVHGVGLCFHAALQKKTGLRRVPSKVARGEIRRPNPTPRCGHWPLRYGRCRSLRGSTRPRHGRGRSRPESCRASLRGWRWLPPRYRHRRRTPYPTCRWSRQPRLGWSVRRSGCPRSGRSRRSGSSGSRHPRSCAAPPGRS